MPLMAAMRAALRSRQAEVTVAKRHRMIIDSAVDHAILTSSLDGRVTSWNAGAQAILGYAPEDIVGQPSSRLFTDDDIAADVPTLDMRAAQAGTGVRTERWHCHRDGTRVWSSGRLLVLRDPHGQLAGYLQILRDHSAEKAARDAQDAELEARVAERTRALTNANKQLQAELRERERTADKIRQTQKIEAIAHLTGGVAHDFNNLLTAILGGLEVIRRRTDDPGNLRLIDSAISAAQRGAKLIAQLRAFARQQYLSATDLALNTLVQEMREPLERSAGESVRIEYDLTADAWPAMADAGQMRSALLNLASNARDALPDGGTLRIGTANRHIATAETDLAAGDYAALSVSDDGTGMSSDVKAQLFEPFFTTKEFGKGTGLGLAQVYGFARQSGGTVRVCSEPGKGTTITILLPRAAEAD
ncbi:MAG TPA: ATP-binding protein [Rhodopila sp.]|jgi:PAS domain S-box-containing protein|nr:ATP-binding protein [Rhodopila sp.]